MKCYIVPWWSSWLSDQISFSNPESDVVREFQGCHYGRHFDIGTEPFSNSEPSCHPSCHSMPSIKFRLNLTYGLGGDLV